jgi:DNA-binding NtrC family response regulator
MSREDVEWCAMTHQPDGEGPARSYLGEADPDVRRAAETDVSVLISGPAEETAAVAELIHRQRQRRPGPFLVLLCRRPKTTADAAAGARGPSDPAKAMSSLIEEARGGTLVLREIDAMEPELQQDLLQMLTVERLGRPPITADDRRRTRVIATTEANLVEEAAAERFNEDLLYRLNTIHIVLPEGRRRRRQAGTSGAGIDPPS